MKQTWEKVIDTLADFEGIVTEFGEKAKLSHPDYKRFIKIKSAWERCQKAINEFDGFVSPVESIAIKFPAIDQDFLENWKFYKEYMQEQFGIYMRSRYEVKALELLWKIADSKPDVAIEILDFSMGKGYKGFFKPIEPKAETETITEKIAAYDPDFN